MLAMLIVGAVLLIAPLAFMFALMGGDVGEVTPLHIVGALAAGVLIPPICCATVLTLICGPRHRRSSFLGVLARFLIANFLFIVAGVASMALVPEAADAVVWIGWPIAIGCVIVMTVTGSARRKVVLTIVIALIAGLISSGVMRVVERWLPAEMQQQAAPNG